MIRNGETGFLVEDIAEADLDTLQSLVDKSLLRRRGDRFVMLETIREFATERLDGSGEAEALSGRHTRFYTALAQEGEPHLWRDDIEWLDRLESEHDNLRKQLYFCRKLLL